MKNLTPVALAFSLLLVFASQNAQAQAQIEIGPRVGYEIDNLEELFVGADVRISTVALPVQINPAFDYYFVDGDLTLFQLTANALYEFGINNEVFTPYAGGGVSYARFSNGASSSDTGLNLVGGAEFGVQSLKAFAQAEVVLIGDFEPVKISAGVLFGLGGE